ncbi:MAG: histidine ammonia-lyase [Phycisphaeraceae bacterium]|nr:histidine ammonia-lyase [Phycisphaeraceae bacterium]
MPPQRRTTRSPRPARRPTSRARGVTLDGSPLTPDLVDSVARAGSPVRLGDSARSALAQSRAALEACISDGEPHYGLNTGFGSFSRQRIPDKDLSDLQRNLVRSHAAGVGTPLPTATVRGMMLLLAASLSRGLSGVRPVVVERLLAMLNAPPTGVTPVVPEIGSVGASGDLAPLAHIALVLLGEGEAEFRGKVMPGAKALKAAHIPPLSLQAKEGLALINGTHLMAARGALLMIGVDRLFSAALTAAAMSIDACRATDAFLDERVHDARCQPGQAAVAARLRDRLRASQIIPSHRVNDPRVQDPYSLRCIPQVLGAAWDAAQYVRFHIDAELGAVTDNPLVFRRPPRREADIVSAGNFHGMPIALPLDVLSIALGHVAGIAERRIYHMLGAFDPDAGLPAYLSPKPGLHSGLMIAQYTAAACCNEMVGLANPASVANISTSAGMEDYNSFGPRAAAKAERSLELARHVVAIELLCAAEAIEHHRPLRSGAAVERAHAMIRTRVPPLKRDRPPAPDIAEIAAMIERGDFAD